MITDQKEFQKEFVNVEMKRPLYNRRKQESKHVHQLQDEHH